MRQIAERLAADWMSMTVATSPHPARLPDVVRDGVQVVSFAITGNWAKGMKGTVEECQAFLRQSYLSVQLRHKLTLWWESLKKFLSDDKTKFTSETAKVSNWGDGLTWNEIVL